MSPLIGATYCGHLLVDMHSSAGGIDRQFVCADKLIGNANQIAMAAPSKSARAVVPSEPIGLDLAELETFVAVAEFGSFSDAAQHLHITQPSVTGRVQRLEHSLGAKLLVRTTRRVELTPAGVGLLNEATVALRGLRKIVSKHRQQARLARQRVVVASTPMMAALVLPPLIRDYSKAYTDVQVVLKDLRHPEALEALAAGAVDLAVLAYDGRDNRFRALQLSAQEMVLVAPRHHPLARFRSVSLEQLASHPILVIEVYESLRQRIADALKERGLEMAPSAIVDNLNTLLGMLDADMGAALLPRSMGRRSEASGHVLIEIEDIKLERRFAILRSRKTELGTAADSFSKFLKAHA